MMLENIHWDSVKQLGSHFKLCLYLFIIIVLVFDIHGFPDISTNDAFQLFAWTRKESDKLNNGYKLIAMINSQVNKNDSLIVEATIRVAGLPEWFRYVRSAYSSLKITFTNSKPPNIIKCSQAFDQCLWLNDFQLIFDNEKDTIKFPFPLPDIVNPYRKYDYFTISINDSVHLQFHAEQDDIFIGSFLNNKHRNNPEKWLIAKGAIMVKTSDKAPFKIHNIELSAKSKDLFNSYLGINLSRLSTNCDFYGMDLIDTSIREQIIHVNSVTIPNTSILFVDSTYKITWSTDNKDIIKTCSLYVSYNKGVRWLPLGKSNTVQYEWFIPDNGKSQCIIQVRAIGYEGQNSIAISEVYAISTSSEFRLQATAINNSSAQLTWNPKLLDTTNLNSIIIAYSTDRSVLTFQDKHADTIYYNLNTVSDTIVNLKTNFLYYFAAFKLTKDGQFASAGPLACDSEKIIDNIPPENGFLLTSSIDTLGITLTWKNLSIKPTDAESIGIFMCRFRYPVSNDDTTATLMKMFPESDASHSLDTLEPGITYYFALMVKDSSGNWSKPTDKSIARARWGDEKINVVQFIPGDKQSLFNDSLQIWSTSNLSLTDTIDYWEGPINGFIVASPGFLLRNGIKINEPVWVQVPYLSTLIQEKAKKILLYRYDIYEDGWIVNHGICKVDTINHTVSAVDSYPAYPFMFLIDTLPPSVKLLNGNINPIKTSQCVYDTLTVQDNIKNYDLQYIAGPGDIEPWDLSLYIKRIDTLHNVQLIGITTPPGTADACSGLRSSFMVSDKINNISINLSRPVTRENDNCDNITFIEQQWTPLMVSAQPDHPEIKSIMQHSSVNNDWNYNPQELRIIKWLPDQVQVFEGGWVEYSTTDDKLFNMKPGTISWIRTKIHTTINFGTAIIPRLIDTQSVIIKPGQWIDFSNPFPFDINIGDILQTSAFISSSKSADSLEFYIWHTSKGLYQTRPLYLAAMPGLHELIDTIKCMKPYAIYNPSKKPVTLYIPPVCVPMSMISKQKEMLIKKSNNSNQWSLSIDSWIKDSSSLPPVYCGQIAGLLRDITYNISPSFSQQRLSIFDSQNRIRWGSIVCPKKSEYGNYFEILFQNNASYPVSIIASIGKSFCIDESFLMKWYDPEGNNWTDANDTIQVSLNPKQNQIRFLAVGKENYFNELRTIIPRNILVLKSVYPNPFNRYFTMQFALPYRTQKVTFNIYNLIGQVLWRKEILNPRPGLSTLNMNMRLATGMYILQMKVKVEGSSSPKVINKAVMCSK